MNELKIENLSKHYGKKAALNNVSITLTDGIYGLLGPNGAGKSCCRFVCRSPSTGR